MNAYIYRAALYCESCVQGLPEYTGPGYSGDSDVQPTGPYDVAGWKSDTPDHCEGCAVFLENPLTERGRDYVLALRAGLRGRSPQVLEWARFYGLDGAAGPTPQRGCMLCGTTCGESDCEECEEGGFACRTCQEKKHLARDGRPVAYGALVTCPESDQYLVTASTRQAVRAFVFEKHLPCPTCGAVGLLEYTEPLRVLTLP